MGKGTRGKRRDSGGISYRLTEMPQNRVAVAFGACLRGWQWGFPVDGFLVAL